MNEPHSLRTLSVAEWAQLVQGGASLNVRTQLDGISMQPLIRRAKDLVTVSPLQRPVKRGDIVLFRRSDGAYVVHRVRRLAGDTITTLGDNCWAEDAPIRAGDVLGLAVQLQRGRCSIRLDTPLLRAAGRLWMACHGGRIFYRRVRSAMIRRIKRVLKWKKAEL